jgi:hypothetical protein
MHYHSGIFDPLLASIPPKICEIDLCICSASNLGQYLAVARGVAIRPAREALAVQLQTPGGKGLFIDSQTRQLQPTREIRRHVRALARNHPEGWKLPGHGSPGMGRGSMAPTIDRDQKQLQYSFRHLEWEGRQWPLLLLLALLCSRA